VSIDSQQLAELERDIIVGKKIAALNEIRDRQLYRLRGYDAFEDYCCKEWDLSDDVDTLFPMSPLLPTNGQGGKRTSTTQGQSASTNDKERQIGATLAVNLRIVKAKCPGQIYEHIDLNAGSGWNTDFGVVGSPLVFIQLAEEHLGSNWRAVFYEIDQERAAELASRLKGIPRCTVLQLDNKEFYERSKHIRGNSVGSVLIDPNGWLYRTPQGIGCPPLDNLRAFFAEHRRMDFIANLNLRFYKQARGAEQNHRRHPDYSNMPRLADIPALFYKRHGLISNKSSNGHSTFVRMVLRNLPTNDYKAMGWYHLDSPLAQQLFEYAETNTAARNRQLPLNTEPVT
jgi:hypothetical protein